MYFLVNCQLLFVLDIKIKSFIFLLISFILITFMFRFYIKYICWYLFNWNKQFCRTSDEFMNYLQLNLLI